MPIGRKVYTEVTDEEARKYDHTHKWRGNREIPSCKRCGQSKIGLGIWGDDEWRRQHKGWERPCQGFTSFWANVDIKGIVGDMKSGSI